MILLLHSAISSTLQVYIILLSTIIITRFNRIVIEFLFIFRRIEKSLLTFLHLIAPLMFPINIIIISFDHMHYIYVYVSLALFVQWHCYVCVNTVIRWGTRWINKNKHWLRHTGIKQRYLRQVFNCVFLLQSTHLWRLIANHYYKFYQC